MARVETCVPAAIVVLAFSACGFDLPLTRPAAVEEQVRRGATIAVGETTRAEVHALLGAPWLASRAWNFEAYRADAEQRELAFVALLTPPIPIAVTRETVTGFVLSAYGQGDVVSEVAANSPSGDSRGVLLHVGHISLGVEAIESHGPQVFADAAAIAPWLVARRSARECTLVLACEVNPRDRWLGESCPDRASVGGAEALDLRGHFTACEGEACPEGAPTRGGFARIPLAIPVMLAPGEHALSLASSTFRGRSDHAFSCAAGDVLFARVRGEVKRHWWGPSKSTLTARVEMSAELPTSARLLLYRAGRWLVEPEPAP